MYHLSQVHASARDPHGGKREFGEDDEGEEKEEEKRMEKKEEGTRIPHWDRCVAIELANGDRYYRRRRIGRSGVQDGSWSGKRQARQRRRRRLGRSDGRDTRGWWCHQC